MSGVTEDSIKPVKIKASDHDIYAVTTIVSLLIPLIGIILGAVYLSKETKVDRKLGEHLIAVGIFSCLIAGIIWSIFGLNQIITPFSPASVTPIAAPQVAPVTPNWDINGQYSKISPGMTKEAVESTISKSATNCSESEQSGSTDKYSSCTYGGGASDGGIIIVNYKNNVVTTTEKSTF